MEVVGGHASHHFGQAVGSLGQDHLITTRDELDRRTLANSPLLGASILLYPTPRPRPRMRVHNFSGAVSRIVECLAICARVPGLPLLAGHPPEIRW